MFTSRQILVSACMTTATAAFSMAATINVPADQATIQAGIDWHHQSCRYNMAFLDGHTDLVHIRKGMHATPKYTFLPWHNSESESVDCQQRKYYE